MDNGSASLAASHISLLEFPAAYIYSQSVLGGKVDSVDKDHQPCNIRQDIACVI